MWSWISLALLLLWITYSLSRPNRHNLLSETKRSYSPQEAADLAYEVKRASALLFLGYGVILGALIFSIITS